MAYLPVESRDCQEGKNFPARPGLPVTRAGELVINSEPPLKGWARYITFIRFSVEEISRLSLIRKNRGNNSGKRGITMHLIRFLPRKLEAIHGRIWGPEK